MKAFWAPSRELAAHRASRGGPRIYDPRERWLLRAIDVLCGVGSIPLRLRPRPSDRGLRILPTAIRKVTALRLDRIGDLITTLPALRQLKRALPEAELELAVGTWNAPIVDQLDFVDSVRLIDTPWASWDKKTTYSAAMRSLRGSGADLMIDFQGDFRVLAMVALARPRFRAGYADTGGGYVLTHRGQWDERISWYRQNMNLVTTLFPDATTPRPITPINFLLDADRRAAKARLEQKGLGSERRPLIGIHPSAGRSLKQWSASNFGSLIRALGSDGDVVLTGTESDRALIESILTGLAEQERPALWVGEGSLREFAAFIERLDVFVTGDTGPMHIAQSVDTPNVALFGPSDPARYGPDGDASRLVVRESVYCSPCNMIRRPPTECALAATPDCMAAIGVESVLVAVRHQLARHTS